MATAIWPSPLPTIVGMNYTETAPADTFLVTRFEKGPSARRRNSSAGLRRATVEIPNLTTVQFQFFEQWFESVPGSGTLPFEMPRPGTGLLRTWAFSDPQAAYQASYVTWNRVRLTMALDLYPPTT